MTKTVNYNLNKPEAADPLRLDDFNDNANKIDAALANLNTALGTKAEQSALETVQTMATAEKIRIGSYEGDGTGGRTVELGFTPRAILLMTQWDSYAAICIATADFAYSAYKTDREKSSIRIVENGVYISGNLYNNNNYPNHYIAFL